MTMMNRRVQRVADSIRQIIAELLLRDVRDPRVGLVTITSVVLSADLRHARVYFSVMGDAVAREETRAGLRSASGFLRTELAHRLNLRTVPELAFEFDPSFEEAERVLRLLKKEIPDEGEGER